MHSFMRSNNKNLGLKYSEPKIVVLIATGMEVTSSIQRSPDATEFEWNFLFNAAITKLSKHYTLYMVIYLRTEELNIYAS